MKILVTGASGFIGSFIVEEALRREMEVWAAVRKSSSKKYLTDKRIHFIELNLSSEKDLEKQLAGHEFDYVVHAAGVTKCLHADDFYKINTDGTRHLVEALLALHMPIRRFIYLFMAQSKSNNLITRLQKTTIRSQTRRMGKANSWPKRI